MSSHRDPGLLSSQGCDETRLFGDSADGSLIKCSELGARGKDKAVRFNRSISPELLDGTLDAIDGDGDVGINAGLVIGELDSGFGSPGGLRSWRGESGDREEGTGKCGDVDELHLE